jgi:hypothetical protein
MTMKLTIRLICLGAIFLACGYGAKAQDAVTPPAPSAAVGAGNTAVPAAGDDITQWVPVGQDTLDEMRGGYDMGNGLVASFGIDRAVYVNGELVTSTSFYVPDIAHMTAAQATSMATALNSVSVTQVGPNNTFSPSALGGMSAGTVIQNTLNNQRIQSITTLNTTVNTLNAFREANFQEGLQQAQLQSLGH